MIAGLQPGDAFADFLDDARALVAAHNREPGHDVTVPEVLVRVAQASRHEADQHLAGLGRVQVELGYLEVLASSAQDRGLGLH